MRSGEVLKELCRLRKIHEAAGQYRQRDAIDYAIKLVSIQTAKDCMYRKEDGKGCKLLIGQNCAECTFMITLEEYKAAQAAHEEKMKRDGIEAYTEKVNGIARRRAKKKKEE